MRMIFREWNEMEMLPPMQNCSASRCFGANRVGFTSCQTARRSPTATCDSTDNFPTQSNIFRGHWPAPLDALHSKNGSAEKRMRKEQRAVTVVTIQHWTWLSLRAGPGARNSTVILDIVDRPLIFAAVSVLVYCTVLWRCWLGGRKGTRPVKTEWWGAGVVICLERGADLHTAQLMPLPPTVSCFSKIQTGFTFLVPAHLGSPGQRAVKWVCVY